MICQQYYKPRADRGFLRFQKNPDCNIFSNARVLPSTPEINRLTAFWNKVYKHRVQRIDIY